jgi:hypothetical protein
MLRAVFLLVPIVFACVGVIPAQIIPRPTQPPRPSPTPTVSPSPTPEPRALPCPNVSVQPSSPQPVREGQAISFSANIAGGDPRIQPMIVWSTSAGTVVSGQNSRKIEVDTAGAGTNTPDRQVVADVWVSGYAPECLLQAKAAIKIIPPAVKFGEFGEVDANGLSTNLNIVAKFLEQSPDSLFLIAYAGRNSERGFTVNWLKKIRDGLAAAGVAPRRINAVDGGFRETPLFDFWMVPQGAEPPRPAPTLNRNEIVYPKPSPTPAPVRKPS